MKYQDIAVWRWLTAIARPEVVCIVRIDRQWRVWRWDKTWKQMWNELVCRENPQDMVRFVTMEAARDDYGLLVRP